MTVTTRVESVFGREIAPGVHMIGPARRGLGKGGYSRSYLFEDDEGKLTLVDTGWDADAGGILRYLDDIGRAPKEIEHIAITHAHRSHLGGVARLAELTGAKVMSHEAEAPIIARKERARPIRLWPLRPVKLLLFRVVSWLPILNHKRCEVDGYLNDLDTVGPLTVLHTPGHTPGHLVFRYRDSVLAVGDAVATWPKFGPGWPGFNRDERQYRKSLERVIELAPDVVCPGHGDPIVEDTAERLDSLSRRRRSRGSRA
jgi:glyoxylase-like metal-dependent hydrolase (beta-lactamase superfamily II)